MNAVTVVITEEQRKHVAEALYRLRNPNVYPMTIGQIEDHQVGIRPLPKKTKPEPMREVPKLPDETYNFLKRNGNAPS